MRRISTVLLLAFSVTLFGQIQDPVDWTFTWNELDNGTYELISTATIEEGWKIYSQYLESDDGPIRTSFFYDDETGFETIGKNEETGDIEKGYDDIFGMDVVSIKKKATFTQRIRLQEGYTGPITGYLEFMACNDEMCLPPTEEMFSFDVPGPDVSDGEPASAPEEESTALIEDVAVTAEADPAQGILQPVTWTSSFADLGANQYRLSFTAEIESGWTLYSKDVDPSAGPQPTTLLLNEASHFTWDGEVEEEGKKIKEGYDNVFAANLKKITEGPAIYRVTLEVDDPTEPVTGELSFMTCDDSKCLPPAYLDIVFRADEGVLLLGDEATTFLAAREGDDTSAGEMTYAMVKPDLENPVGTCSTDQETVAQASIWRIFGLGFLGGLLALLTPCVFPMIPLTVSFFTKSSGNRQKGIRDAILYGGFILLVYLVLSIPFHLMDSINPDILNDISTNIWLNLFFFAVFLFFAFSFFGYYELTLPEKWTNRASQAEGVGGVLGIFFMALTLALVSFSCTGPILGSLLAGALTSNGGAWQLTAGMGGFGLALALPFALFALFPGMMKTLPKSGGWLNTVKVVLGFLELALALKFLSNADLVKHWGILKIEPFLGLWMLIFLGLGLYAFGLIKFPHDSPKTKLGAGRVTLGVLSLAFVVYLGSGFLYSEQSGSYRPLKLLSGLAPPVCYSMVYDCDCPQNLECFKDLDEGLAFAKKQNKPVMIDFTGHACVNCRKMEEHVWPERDVYNQLRDDYVLISLYVDDKRELPEAEQIVVEKATGGTRKLRRVGDKWAHFQTEYFQTNTQPYYVLLSPEGEKLLNQPVGYTPDVSEFAEFLQCGKDAFQRIAEQ
jgi:thiol:disulfide interchange protein DsbD